MLASSAVFALVLASGDVVAVVAHHEVALHQGEIAVSTTWSSREVADERGRVALAVPLPAGVTITGAAPETDGNGKVIALRLDVPESARPHVDLRAPLDWGAGLPLPVAAASQVQRVRLTDALRFSPDASLGLVAHLGQTVPPAWHRHDRLAVDSRLPGDRPRVGALYVPTDAVVHAGGVLGTIELREHGRRRTAIGIGVVFVVLCGAGAWAYRRARRSAEAEHAELVLAAEFEGLGDGVEERR
jgi:hypothetical protein